MILKSTLASVAILMVGCQQSPTGTQVQSFGETQRSRTKPLEKCTVIDEALPQSTAYLQRLFNHMVSKNPKTFKGIYSPEKFCVGVILSSERIAYTQSIDGSIVFYSKILEEAHDDYYVASVLAHEAAHVTMNNRGILSNHYWETMTKADRADLTSFTTEKESEMLIAKSLFKELGSTVTLDFFYQDVEGTILNYFNEPDASKRLILLNSLLSKAEGSKSCVKSCEDLKIKFLEVIVQSTKVNILNKNMNAIYLKYFSKEEIANGPEKEADEVGLELYARSGYSIPLYGMFGMKNLRESGNYEKCAQEMMSTRTKEPERGTGSHPMDCWRVENYLTKFIAKNSAELAPYFKNEMTQLPGSPSLADAVKEINNAKKDAAATKTIGK